MADKIVRWNADRGFGFVRLEDGREAFLHVSDVEPKQPRGVDLGGQKVEIHRTTTGPKGLRVASATLVADLETLRARAYPTEGWLVTFGGFPREAKPVGFTADGQRATFRVEEEFRPEEGRGYTLIVRVGSAEGRAWLGISKKPAEVWVRLGVVEAWLSISRGEYASPFYLAAGARGLAAVVHNEDVDRCVLCGNHARLGHAEACPVKRSGRSPEEVAEANRKFGQSLLVGTNRDLGSPRVYASLLAIQQVCEELGVDPLEAFTRLGTQLVYGGPFQADTEDQRTQKVRELLSLAFKERRD